MKMVVKFLLLLCYFLYLPLINAAEFRASVDITGTYWINASGSSMSEKIPVSWVDASKLALPTVEQWVPGTFASLPPKQVRFSSNALGNFWESTDVPITVEGVQYNNIGIKNSINSSGIGRGCSLDKIMGSLIDVRGDSCVSSQKIVHDKSSAPFVLFRPIITIKDKDIENALKGLPKGSYTTSFPIAIKINYYVGNVLTYRVVSEQITIIIDYDPVWITSVNLSDERVEIDPEYDSFSRTIKGTSKDVIVEVLGYFDNGIKVDVENRLYYLKHNEKSNFTIPFFVKCISCGETQSDTIELIDSNGRVVNSSVNVGEAPNTSIIFSLRFGYKDIDGTELISGEYSDTVDFIIRAEI